MTACSYTWHLRVSSFGLLSGEKSEIFRQLSGFGDDQKAPLFSLNLSARTHSSTLSVLQLHTLLPLALTHPRPLARPKMASSSALFQPIRVGRMELKHRLAMAPLTRFRADEHHVHQDLAVEYYGQRASEPGTLLVTEATFIDPVAGGYPNVPGCFNADQVAGWKKVVDEVHRKGSCKWFRQLRFVVSADLTLARSHLPPALGSRSRCRPQQPQEGGQRRCRLGFRHSVRGRCQAAPAFQAGDPGEQRTCSPELVSRLLTLFRPSRTTSTTMRVLPSSSSRKLVVMVLKSTSASRAAFSEPRRPLLTFLRAAPTDTSSTSSSSPSRTTAPTSTAARSRTAPGSLLKSRAP